MTFINKPIDTIALTDITLVVLSFVLVGDLLLSLKEVGEEAIVLGSRRQWNWRFWDK